MAENPKVHSKGMTFHGKPHAPQHVASPGGESALPDQGGPLAHLQGAPETASRTVHHAPGTLGHMERGERAAHPTHGKR